MIFRMQVPPRFTQLGEGTRHEYDAFYDASYDASYDALNDPIYAVFRIF